MSKSLQTIQKLAKMGKVLSKIVKICSIVGAVGCLVGITVLSISGGVSIHGIIEKSADVSMGTIYASMSVGMILCIGEIILAVLAERYFKHELEAGSPFTTEGAKEIRTLGICNIVIPIVVMIIADITYKIINHTFTNVADLNIDDYSSIGLGITFIVVSLLLQYGAELRESGRE